VVEETRLKTTAIMAAVTTLAGIGIVEALDQFGAPPVLAAFFPLLPLAIALVVALSMRSLAFADTVQGGAIGGPAAGWALAGLSSTALVLLAAPVATALGGFWGLAMILAFLAGLGLAIFQIVPRLRATGAVTLASAIGRRFGAPSRGFAALAIALTLVPLVAAEASLAGMVGARLLGVPEGTARTLLIAGAALAAVLGGVRAALAMAAVTAPIVAIAYLTPITLVSLDAGPLPMPWLGLLEGEAFDAPTRFPSTVILALIVCLVAGMATLPTLLFPAWTVPKRRGARQDLRLGLVVIAALLLAAPSYALFAGAFGVDPTTNPAGVVLSLPQMARLSAAPSVLLIGGLLTAALVAATGALATAASAIGNDLYLELVERRAPEGRRVFITRLAAVALAFVAAGLCEAADGNPAVLAASGLSIGAASLGPLLLIGWPIRTVSALAAVASLAVGLALTVADMALAVLLPDVSGRFLGMGPIAQTVLGPTGWFGLPIGLSGLAGVLFGLLTLWAVTELPRMDWPAIGQRLKTRARAVAALASRPPAMAPAGGISSIAPSPEAGDLPPAPPVPAPAEVNAPAPDSPSAPASSPADRPAT